MSRFYAAFGALVLAVLTWAQFTGWSLTDPTERKTVPKSVRDSPGSYRSSYGSRFYTGAK